jgi:formylglycine-generating enzyme required for sulfatase activity
MCAMYREPETDEPTPTYRPREPHRLATNAAIFVVVTVLILLGVYVVTPWVVERNLAKDLKRADWLVAHGPMEEAIHVLDGVIQRAPPNSAVYHRASQARDAAERYIEEAASLKNQADDAFKNEQFKKSLELYGRIAEQYPLSLAGRTAERDQQAARDLGCQKHQDLARSAANERRWLDAKNHWEQVLLLNPEYPGAPEGLSAAEEQIRRFEEMLSSGKAAAEGKRWPESRSYYEKALAIMPASEVAYDGRTLALKNIPPPPDMVLIDPGDCVLGPGDGREAPETVRMDGFYMDRTEVKNAEYEKFVSATRHAPPANWPNGKLPKEIEHFPVMCVSWEDAAAFAAWAGKRLPTADEWERAARGREARKYPWGNGFTGEEAVFWYNVAPAARLESDRTEEGCFDMGGNLSEWTADKATRPRRFPAPTVTRYYVKNWHDEAQYRVLCGESWAGLEHDRPAGFVLRGLANPSSYAGRTVLVDKPGLYGAEVMEFCETFYLLRDVRRESARFEIRKWFEASGRFVAGYFDIAPGEWIGGNRMVMFGRGPDAESVDANMDTRWKLVEIEAVDPARVEAPTVICESFNGLRVGVERSTLPRVDAMDYSLPDLGRRDRSNRDDLLKEQRPRFLAGAAMCTHRRVAPEFGKYINVGFRCVKDL